MLKKLLFPLLLVTAGNLNAQIIHGFESQPLSGADTYYVNFTAPGTDVGFYETSAEMDSVYFPCVYDTSFGFGYWSSGFAYSNMTDSITAGYTNQYSAIAAKGQAGSEKYAVAYGTSNYILIDQGNEAGVVGMYVTNNTYAYRSMLNGDAFGKKFGGPTGNDPDFFKLTITGYYSGISGPDFVQEIYLADFRDTNNAADYILKDWMFVPLNNFLLADSITFALSSSDTGAFGMNTPAYFCLDNIQMAARESVDDLHTNAVHVFPNPAVATLFIKNAPNETMQYSIADVSGKICGRGILQPNNGIDIEGLLPGYFTLTLHSRSGQSILPFLKK